MRKKWNYIERKLNKYQPDLAPKSFPSRIDVVVVAPLSQESKLLGALLIDWIFPARISRLWLCWLCVCLARCVVVCFFVCFVALWTFDRCGLINRSRNSWRNVCATMIIHRKLVVGWARSLARWHYKKNATRNSFQFATFKFQFHRNFLLSPRLGSRLFSN